MSEERIAEYQQASLRVACWQNQRFGGDLDGRCEDGQHAWRLTGSEWSSPVVCKWCGLAREAYVEASSR